MNTANYQLLPMNHDPSLITANYQLYCLLTQTRLLPAHGITTTAYSRTYLLSPRQAALPERELLHVADAHGH